jgi:hypothetical protein
MAQPKNSNTKAAYDAYNQARKNPYVQRLLEDEELRDTIRAAFVSAQEAYRRVQKAKAPQKVVMDDKKFHKDLKNAAEALRDAGATLKDGPRKRSHPLAKAAVLAAILGLIALASSSDLRDKVLDLLFGAEEEFDYMSTTSPSASPAPDSPPAA